MRYILYAILIYIAYQFLFNLVVPVYKTTRKIKKGFREMHEQMNKQQANTSGSNGKQREQSIPQKEEKGDYIDFEEVK